jgi:hypothetical protein
MQQETDGIQPGSAGRDQKYHTVVSDLASVIEQVRNSLKLIESEIASETPPDEAAAGDVVVLDDVTPSYTRAYAVLRECDAGLSVALRLLLESVGARTGEFRSGALPPV